MYCVYLDQCYKYKSINIVKLKRMTKFLPSDNWGISKVGKSQMGALSAISRKGTEIIHMMSDQNNIDLVRNELTTFKTRYQEEQNNFYQVLKTADEKDQSSLAFSLKDSESFEFRKKVVQCLTVWEQRLNNQLDQILEQCSHTSHSSRSSRSSGRSHTSKSSRLLAARKSESCGTLSVMFNAR